MKKNRKYKSLFYLNFSYIYNTHRKKNINNLAMASNNESLFRRELNLVL